jgi:hypothetical protein
MSRRIRLNLFNRALAPARQQRTEEGERARLHGGEGWAEGKIKIHHKGDDGYIFSEDFLSYREKEFCVPRLAAPGRAEKNGRVLEHDEGLRHDAPGGASLMLLRLRIQTLRQRVSPPQTVQKHLLHFQQQVLHVEHMAMCVEAHFDAHDCPPFALS